jgi:hypothetical protein
MNGWLEEPNAFAANFLLLSLGSHESRNIFRHFYDHSSPRQKFQIQPKKPIPFDKSISTYNYSNYRKRLENKEKNDKVIKNLTGFQKFF